MLHRLEKFPTSQKNNAPQAQVFPMFRPTFLNAQVATKAELQGSPYKAKRSGEL
jgi:hypothetical protein